MNKAITFANLKIWGKIPSSRDLLNITDKLEVIAGLAYFTNLVVIPNISAAFESFSDLITREISWGVVSFKKIECWLGFLR